MDHITIEQMHAHVDEEGLEVLTFEGYDAAIVGLASQGHRYVAVYDYDRLLETLMAVNEWSEEDAVEWYAFNMTGYTDGAPIVLHMQIVPSPGKGVTAHGTG